MKLVFWIFISILIITKIKCHVTNRTKNEKGITTRIQMENETEKNVSEFKEIKEKKFDTPKTVNTEYHESSRVYLEDVLFALKNMNWTAEEEPCFHDTLILLRSLQNFTLWAVWEWDSISSEPQGLLYGNRYQLGNFDECMNAPWSESHPELRTQYCLAEIVLERTDVSVKKLVFKPYQPYQSALDFIQNRPVYSRPLNELTWGACVPASCQSVSVERLLTTMLLRSHLGTAGMRSRISVKEQCQKVDEPRQFDAVFYAFIAFLALLIAIALLCSYLNRKRKESDPETLKSDIIKAFCLVENAKDLLRMKKEGIEVLYGIRFLTICFIVMDHQIGIFNAGPVSNGLKVDQDALSTFGMFVLHDDLFVDTFFLLSGFLTATTLTKFKRFPNPLFVILKRYIRLVVAFAVVIFYVCAVFPYTGSGPLWPRAIAGDTKQCRKNWWLSLLMLNNYIDSENICIVVSWYIPCDFHFFIITVLMYWLYKRYPRLAVTATGVVVLVSILMPGVVNYIHQMPAIQLFTYDFIKNPRGSEQFHLTYIKSHTRFAAYLVGFFSGYTFTFYSATGNFKIISKIWSVMGASLGLIIMIFVMIFGTTYLWRSYHPLEGAVYAALNRPVWAGGVALLVLCCSLGQVPLISKFLSWYPWVPLSRLSYGLYLSHTVFISRNVFVTRNPEHSDYFELLNTSIGIIFWGCVAALIIWLLAEAPANNLLALCLKAKVKQLALKENGSSVTQSTSVGNLTTGCNSHLQENLSTTVVHFSSKI